MFYSTERLAVMIDGVNLHGMVRALGLDLDFRRLHAEFMKRGRLIRMGYYTPLQDSDEHLPVKPLLDWLSYHGYDVVIRTAREYEDHTGRRRLKGSSTTNLVVDALDLAPSIDHFVLISGDGDYVPLVESLKRRGVRVTLISTVKTSPPIASDDLRRVADNFVDIADWEGAISKRQN